MDDARDGATTRTDDVAVLRIEDAVARLPGVDAVRLVPGRHRAVDELHVVIDPDRPEDGVRRSVQALLLERFELAVDWHAIRTMPRPRTALPASQGPTPRLVLETVHLAVRGRDTTVAVDLRHGDELLHGDADPVAPEGLLRAVASATLTAVGGTVDDALEAVSAEVVQAGQDRVALATVVTTDGRGRQQFTGSALVRGNEADAIARAVLDATNRLRRD